MKNIFASVAIAAILASNANAVELNYVAGKVIAVHLNGDAPNRHVCIRMSPEIPDYRWACVYTDNPLHKEMYSLLLTANTASKTCKLGWANTDVNNHIIIALAECG